MGSIVDESQLSLQRWNRLRFRQILHYVVPGHAISYPRLDIFNYKPRTMVYPGTNHHSFLHLRLRRRHPYSYFHPALGLITLVKFSGHLCNVPIYTQHGEIY